jgi:hypothetical protein
MIEPRSRLFVRLFGRLFGAKDISVEFQGKSALVSGHFSMLSPLGKWFPGAVMLSSATALPLRALLVCIAYCQLCAITMAILFGLLASVLP